MKLRNLRIKNFRSVEYADIEIHNYTMLVGANNAGKSNIMAALRAFYENIPWTVKDDSPKFFGFDINNDNFESWVELNFELSDDEWKNLATIHKDENSPNTLIVRRYFVHKERVKSKQSNIYSVVNGVVNESLFYGAKNIGTAKLGSIIYIPALISANDQIKTSGASPLRDMLNLMLKKVIDSSPAYQQITESFAKFNEEAKNENGFLDKIVQPINKAISNWGIEFNMSISPISPEDVTKNLIGHAFTDTMLGNNPLSLDKYGDGFQRSFLYELIKLAPEITNENKLVLKDNEFNPDFTLILFEEPEAFLHPAQQENMAYHLRRLSQGDNQQIIITSHSSIFTSKATDDLCQIIRVHRENGKTSIGQVKTGKLSDIFDEGLNFKKCLTNFVNNTNIPDSEKTEARRLLNNSEQDEEIEKQNEKFRYQLWLDSDRTSMFFADKVLLVEGSTEKALFNWLIAKNDEWHLFSKYRIAIIDVIGKFNFHRYMALLDELGIPYGLILDDDEDKNHHKAINEMVKNYSCDKRLAEPVFIPNCIEPFLELELPSRPDLKPIEIIKKLENGEISYSNLQKLKDKFSQSLNIN